MKKIALLLLIISQFSIAQSLTKEQLTDKLAKIGCECIEKKEFDKDNFEEIMTQCIGTASKGYEKDIEKHYGKDAFKSSQDFGYDVGKKLGKNCSGVFTKFMEFSMEEEAVVDSTVVAEEYEEEPALMVSGKFAGAKADGYLFISVKENSGKLNNFILLDKFENSFLITDKVIKLNDKIDVEYYEAELFNVKTNSFVSYKIITNITKI